MSIQLSLLDRYGNVHEQARLNWGIHIDMFLMKILIYL